MKIECCWVDLAVTSCRGSCQGRRQSRFQAWCSSYAAFATATVSNRGEKCPRATKVIKRQVWKRKFPSMSMPMPLSKDERSNIHNFVIFFHWQSSFSPLSMLSQCSLASLSPLSLRSHHSHFVSPFLLCICWDHAYTQAACSISSILCLLFSIVYKWALSPVAFGHALFIAAPGCNTLWLKRFATFLHL